MSARARAAVLGSALGFALAWSLVSAPAAAFCRAMACGKPGSPTECTRSAEGCLLDGRPLLWTTPCVSFAVQQDGSPLVGVDAATTARLVEDAFAAWLSVDCGGQAPSIQTEDFGEVACAQVEYNSEQGNANVFMFREDPWPHDGPDGALALTTVSFDPETGEIYDADVEINARAGMPGADDPTARAEYLRAVLTHEVGHFFGLSHSFVGGATMQPGYDPGLASLSDDDVSGMCAVYPAARELSSATCEPRHGFSRQCAADDSGCTMNQSAATPSQPWASLTSVVMMLALRGFRRRRPRDSRAATESERY